MTTAPASIPRSTRGFGTGRAVVLVVGSFAALVGAALLLAAAGALWLDQTQRDDAGFVSTPTEVFSTGSYALASTDLRLADPDGGMDWSVDRFGAVRVSGESADGTPIFLGIAAADDVEAYLGGVAYDELAEVRYEPFRATYSPRPGTAPATAPGELDIWVASASGPGAQALEWNLDEGTWTLVVMNADGSRGVSAELSAGAELGFLPWLAVGLALAGVVVLAGGVVLIVVGARQPAPRVEGRT